MSKIFQETEKYISGFYKSRKELYKSAFEDFKPHHIHGYGYPDVKKEHQVPIYNSIKDLYYDFGRGKNIRELDVPEEYATPFKAIEAINNYKDYLLEDKASLEEYIKEYSKNKIPFPLSQTIRYIEEVIDVLEHALNFDELKPYQLKKAELFNIYIKSYDKIQIKHGLNRDNIESILTAIKLAQEEVFVDGRTISLNDLVTLKIYDASKALNKFDKSLLKNEISRHSSLLQIKGLELLKFFGLEVTDKFEIIKPSRPNKISEKIEIKSIPPMNNKKLNRIFISHSSENLKEVGALIDLIECIGIKSSQIFCSSFSGYGVKLGENFLERIKTELNDEILVLFILSKNFYESPICLCEMGATWVKTNKHIPILIPPFSFREVKGVFPLTNGMNITDKDKLNLLKETLETDFSLKNISTTIWEKKRTTFLETIKSQQNETVNEKNITSIFSTLERLFPGKWESKFTLKGKEIIEEEIEIKEGNKFYTKGVHWFDLVDELIDIPNNVLRFKKNGIRNDDRQIYNDLQIIDIGKEYRGTEMDKERNLINIRYYRKQ